MRKAIGYSCYQSEKEIERSLKPWLPHVDYVVAINGRYWTPETPEMKKMNLPNYSTDNTEEELKRVCGDKLIHEKLFAEQMVKRQRYLDIAGELKCDFLITWDSDDYIHPDYQNWNKFDGQLEAVLKHFTDDDIFFMWAWIPDEKLWPRQHNAGIKPNSWKRYVRIHKHPGNMKYVKNHFTWCKKDVTDKQINEWNWNADNWYFDDDQKKTVPVSDNPFILSAAINIDGVRFTTDRAYRSPDQLRFGDGWAFQNMHYETYVYDMLPAVKHKGLKVGLEGYEYFFREDGKRWTYNKDGTVMTQEEIDAILKQEEEIFVRV
jgi:glycosyltransferase involved in cell wall biosynthesis